MGLLSKLFGSKTDYAALLDKKTPVIDVRTPGEFRSGHFKGSKNIPLGDLKNQIKNIKSEEVIVVCKSGMRAAQAKSILKQNGITAHNAGPWQKLERL